MFSSPVSIRLFLRHVAAPRLGPGACAVADLDAVDLTDIRLGDRADRIGKVVMRPLAGGVRVAAEDRLDTDLLRRDRVDAGGEPDEQHDAAGHGHTLAAAHGTAGDDATQTILATTEDLFEVGGRFTAAASTAATPRAAPASIAAAATAPGPSPVAATAAALIAPRHARRYLPLRQ